MELEKRKQYFKEYYKKNREIILSKYKKKSNYSMFAYNHTRGRELIEKKVFTNRDYLYIKLMNEQT